MKKTYDVYSIFEKIGLGAGVRAVAFTFIFSVCFLGVTSEISAQTFNTSPNGGTTGLQQQVDAAFLKNFQFDDAEKASSVQLLRGEFLSLETDPMQQGVGEAEWGARKFYLEALIGKLTMNADMSISEASLGAYTNLVYHVNNNYAVYVDTEEIATYYSSLIDL